MPPSPGSERVSVELASSRASRRSTRGPQTVNLYHPGHSKGRSGPQAGFAGSSATDGPRTSALTPPLLAGFPPQPGPRACRMFWAWRRFFKPLLHSIDKHLLVARGPLGPGCVPVPGRGGSSGLGCQESGMSPGRGECRGKWGDAHRRPGEGGSES